MNPDKSLIISTDEYTTLVRRSVLLDVILSCKIDKAYPSETEKEVLRVRELVDPATPEIQTPEEKGEGDDA